VKLKDCNQRQELVRSAAHIDTNYFYYSSDSSISQGLFNPDREAAPDGGLRGVMRGQAFVPLTLTLSPV
jgi:hypothetical protein